MNFAFILSGQPKFYPVHLKLAITGLYAVWNHQLSKLNDIPGYLLYGPPDLPYDHDLRNYPH